LPKRTRTRSKQKTERQLFAKKMREYREFLKRDFDWDWEFIIRLLQYKLKRTRLTIVSNNIIADAKKVGREIREVEVLLGRVLADRYYELVSKEFRRKWGPLKQKTNKVPGKPYSEWKLWYKNETPKNKKQCRSEHLKLLKAAEKLRRNDLQKAFNLMCERIWGWWD